MHIPENELTQLKSKLRNVCHKCKIKVPYKYQHIIANLTNNKTIKVLKQDKRRCVVIMDSSKYTEKCLGLLKNDQFAKINDDPAERIESKIQRCVRKLKSKIAKEEYSKLYPIGSNPGKFYGTAKIQKISYNDTIDQLPLRPIVSNIGTASYHLPKYLAKLLSTLSQSECTVKISKEFIQKFKNVAPLDTNSKLFSFDASFLFTSVPLDFTIDVI